VPSAAAARGLLVHPEREDVGDRDLARVAHAFCKQEEHGEKGHEEGDRVQEAIEPVEEDQAGDAQERRRRQLWMYPPKRQTSHGGTGLVSGEDGRGRS